MQVTNGVWIKRDDPTIEIYIQRVYKKKDTVNYHYFMCRLTGGGTITKEKLLQEYIKKEI